MTIMKVREYGINYIKKKIIYLDYLETRKSWEIVIPLKHMETFKLVPFILVLPLLFCISKVAEFYCLFCLFVCSFVMLFPSGEMTNNFLLCVCYVCIHVTAYVWRSEDNPLVLILSASMWAPEIKLRSLGPVTSATFSEASHWPRNTFMQSKRGNYREIH